MTNFKHFYCFETFVYGAKFQFIYCVLIYRRDKNHKSTSLLPPFIVVIFLWFGIFMCWFIVHLLESTVRCDFIGRHFIIDVGVSIFGGDLTTIHLYQVMVFMCITRVKAIYGSFLHLDIYFKQWPPNDWHMHIYNCAN